MIASDAKPGCLVDESVCILALATNTLRQAQSAIRAIRHCKPDGCECEACEEIADAEIQIGKTLEEINGIYSANVSRQGRREGEA